MFRLITLSVITFLFSINLYASAAPEALESTLRNFDRYSWTLRPNNLYRWACYIPNSATCEPFPGTSGSRVACSMLVKAQVDTCPTQRSVIDQIVFRVVATIDGKIISSTRDGGDDSTAAACEY